MKFYCSYEKSYLKEYIWLKADWNTGCNNGGVIPRQNDSVEVPKINRKVVKWQRNENLLSLSSPFFYSFTKKCRG